MRITSPAVDGERGHDGVALDRSVRANHLDEVRRAVEPARLTPGWMNVARVGAREEAAVAANPVLEQDPLAAAVPPLSAGRAAQLEPIDVEPVPRLGHLGRAVERVAVESAELRVEPVAVGGRAPAADLGLDDREVAARVGMPPADEGAADRGEAARRQPAREVRREAAQDQVVEPDPHLVVDGVGGGLAAGRTPSPGRVSTVERPEVAGVRRRARARRGSSAPSGPRSSLRRGRGSRARVLVGVVAQVDDEARRARSRPRRGRRHRCPAPRREREACRAGARRALAASPARPGRAGARARRRTSSTP